MATLKLTITDQDGAVYDVLRQSTRGYWYDSDDQELCKGGPDLLRFVLGDLLFRAQRWAEGEDK